MIRPSILGIMVDIMMPAFTTAGRPATEAISEEETPAVVTIELAV